MAQSLGTFGCSEHKEVVSKQMVGGLNNQISKSAEDTLLCEACIVGKQTREPFQVGKRVKSKKPLELVHSDVCGPMPSATFDGFRYFVTFIDDFTHFTIVYLIKQKIEVFQKFKEYEARQQLILVQKFMF